MNIKKIFSLVLLFSIISGTLTTTAFASRQHRKIYKRIHQLEAELNTLKEKIEQQNSLNTKSSEPVEKPVEVIDCNNPEMFERFYTSMVKDGLQLPIGQLMGLYASGKYIAPEEKNFITEITLCIEKAMERMALNDENTNDNERIKEKIAQHKAFIQEMLEKK